MHMCSTVLCISDGFDPLLPLAMALHWPINIWNKLLLWRQHSTVVKNISSGVKKIWAQFPACYLIAVWSSASYLTFLGISFSVYSVDETISTPHRAAVRIRITHVEYSVHSKPSINVRQHPYHCGLREYSWPLNNVGVRDADPLYSQRSTYNLQSALHLCGSSSIFPYLRIQPTCRSRVNCI